MPAQSFLFLIKIFKELGKIIMAKPFLTICQGINTEEKTIYIRLLKKQKQYDIQNEINNR